MAFSHFYAKLEALKFALKGLLDSKWRFARCKLYSDCKSLMIAMDKIKACFICHDFLFCEDLTQVTMELNISFHFIERRLNEDAYGVAKIGLDNNNTILEWY